MKIEGKNFLYVEYVSQKEGIYEQRIYTVWKPTKYNRRYYD